MSEGKLYQLKVSITDSHPLIWRRLLVSAMVSLEELHPILQITMGWGNLAGYHYRVGRRRSDTEPALLRMPLNEIIRDDQTLFSYIYDPRDGWFHTIQVEMILPADPEGVYPHCICGERACPPEGIGGIWGYAELLAALADQRDVDHLAQFERWDTLGNDFDPDGFDADLVNIQLHSR
jgi:hypothetical protein